MGHVLESWVMAAQAAHLRDPGSSAYSEPAGSSRHAADFGSGEGFANQNVIPSPCTIMAERADQDGTGAD